MDKITVDGGARLCGRTDIDGMKNSALPIIYACLLVEEECIIDNIPRVSDVENSLFILRNMGVRADYIAEHTVRIDASGASGKITDNTPVSKMRASSYLMGVLLSRFGKVDIAVPGGCNFGARPIEQHLKSFTSMGAVCSEKDGFVKIRTRKKLKSGKIVLDKISVGATINTVLASALTSGVTTIVNTAREPHVLDVINFLNSCGAKITHRGNEITVCGVKKLHGTFYRIYPDMIEALTYITCVGAAGGNAELCGAEYSHICGVCNIFSSMGMTIKHSNDTISVSCSDRLKGADVVTSPYPLFPTDLHPQFASLLCFTKSGGSIREEVFSSRFGYVPELRKMGALIKQERNTVYISASNMHGADVDATDLRAGAALIVAALGAAGTSTISNVNYIVRGYENIVGKISSLGGKIKLIKEK